VTVHFIGAGPGAADLITVRGRDILARCPVCLYAGSIVSPALLAYCPQGARLVDTAPMSLDEIEAEYVAAHEAGRDVARLHSGDLSVFSAVASRMPEGEQLSAFAATGATLAIHLAIHTLDHVVETLLPFYGADCPVAVVAHASWPEERIVRGTLADIGAKLKANPIERTAVILVGRALAAEDFRESALYDADYRRRFRGGAA
jgi:precorrin-4/cobalt-precorrin-4 C11-methyltransferase